MRGRRDDEGTVLVLTFGLFGVLLLLVAVVVDVSAVILAKRAVASAADSAAVAAAQSLDETALYDAGLGEDVPLSPSLVAEVVQSVAAEAAVTQPGLRMTSGTDGATATVVASRVVRLPFSARFGVSEVDVGSTATARAPLTPVG